MELKKTVTVRVSEQMAADIESFRKTNASKFGKSRSATCAHLLALGLYKNGVPNHVTRSFGRRAQNIVMLITMVLLTLSVFATQFYVNGSLTWRVLLGIIMVTYLFCVLVIGEELLVRVKNEL
jgi:hypothetical protein